MTLRSAATGVLTLACLAATGPAGAHEFIVKPEAIADGKQSFSVIVTEVYMQPDRMPPATTAVMALGGDAPGAVSLTEDAAAKRLTGTVAVGKTPMILAGTSVRLGKPRGKDKAAAKTGGMRKIETFSKALINAKAGDSLHMRPLGTRLEVLPKTNPATLAPGDAMTVRVLFDGKPVAARVQATYDGFSDKEHGYVTRTTSDDDGTARFAVTAPGLWLVRAKVRRDEAGADYQRYEASANIVFNVAAAK